MLLFFKGYKKYLVVPRVITVYKIEDFSPIRKKFNISKSFSETENEKINFVDLPKAVLCMPLSSTIFAIVNKTKKTHPMGWELLDTKNVSCRNKD